MDPAKDIVLNHDSPNETLRIQLCRPLNQKCNGKDGYGICLIRGKEEKGIGFNTFIYFRKGNISIISFFFISQLISFILFLISGKMPPEVDVKNGRIMFIFTGDDCTPHVKYKVNILMKCDYEAGYNSYPELFSYVRIYDHT